MANTYGNDGPAQVVPLTQEDLASLAGTTRPGANKAQRVAEETGLITMSRGEIRLLDPDGLARRARSRDSARRKRGGLPSGAHRALSGAVASSLPVRPFLAPSGPLSG